MKTVQTNKLQRGFTLMHRKEGSKGFTLIELLVVIGILAVLLAITLIAINPARQFEQANDTQRASDVNAILNAVWQYGVENGGNLGPLNIPTEPTAAAVIGSDTVGGEIDLCTTLTQVYIAQMPVDPTSGDWDTDGDGDGCEDYTTGYTIQQSAAGRVTVSAPDTEGTTVISVSR